MIEKQQLVEFQIDKDHYGIDIDLVKEILMTWTVIPVSTLTKEVSGVIFLRGDDIPVINIRHLLNITPAHEDQPARSLVIVGMKNAMGKSFGFLVDSVCNICEIDREDLQKKQHQNSSMEVKFVKNCVNGRIIGESDTKDSVDSDNMSLIWLDSDELIHSAMNECYTLDPKIPYT